MISKERLALGLAALRSGDYAQGRGYLKQDVNGEVKHCCLGVLTDVAIQNGCPNIRMTEGRAHSGWYEIFTSKRAECSPDCNECTDFMEWMPSVRGTLHEQTMDWYGLTEQNPILICRNTDSATRACSANDSLTWGFSRIADAFEDTYMGGDDVQPG